MERRKIVYDRLEVEIKHKDAFASYKRPVTWGEFTSAEILPDDIIVNWQWKHTETQSSWGGNYDDPPVKRVYLVVIIERAREQTDEEYLKDQQEKAKRARQEEEKERLEYLRLKAKYEQ